MHTSTTALVRGQPVMWLALLTALALLFVPSAAADEHEVTPARVQGDDRYETAAEIAALDREAAPDAFIASGEDFPDALATAYAAGDAGEEAGPILLTRHGDLTDPTREALEDLGVERAFIIGGPAAVHPDVEEELEQRVDEVHRIDGDDRYETAAAVAFGWGTGPWGEVGTLDGDRTALLASGEVFPDALTAGPVAAGVHFPLLLTPSDANHPEVDSTLQDLDIERIVVVGGDDAVTSAVLGHYEQQGYEMERWGGENRTETAVVVAENARQRLGFDVSLSLLARGDDFPDALAGAVHAGLRTSPILLTWNPDILGDATHVWFLDRCPDIDVVRALGGPAAVSQETLGEAVDAAEECHEDEPANNQSYIIGPQEPIEGAEPGHEQEFHFIGTYDDGPEDAVELALFPCESVERDQAHVTFVEDPDNPGYALGAGETDTGEAWISQINDVEQTEGQNRDRGMDPDGYNFHLTSEAADCTFPVMWGSGDHEQDDQLPIDDDGEPTVRFGVGEISWTGG